MLPRKRTTRIFRLGHLALTACSNITTVVAFIVFMAVSPAFSQSMGANYSDTWVAFVNQPSTNSAGDILALDKNALPYAYMRGSGITDGSTSSYTHNYSMTATIRSPNGRTQTYSNSGGSYVRVDVSLPFVNGEGGTFTTSHTTSGYCPAAYAYHTLGGGGSTFGVGYSQSVYRKAASLGGNAYRYCIISPCDAICKWSDGCYTYYTSDPPPEYTIQGRIYRIPSGGGTVYCLLGLGKYNESPVRVECFNLDVYPW